MFLLYLLIKKFQKINKMENKEIYLETEESKNIKSNIKVNYSKTVPNLDYKYKKRKNPLNYSKLIFNKNILANILKKTNIKKRPNINHTISTKMNNNPIKSNCLITNFKLSYNLNNKFHNLPGISNFHNITDEKISDLICSTETNLCEHDKSQKNN